MKLIYYFYSLFVYFHFNTLYTFFFFFLVYFILKESEVNSLKEISELSVKDKKLNALHRGKIGAVNNKEIKIARIGR